MNAIDREIVRATQGGLPLVSSPYQSVALKLGLTEGEVIERLKTMVADGRIRRIGAVPNHYALGYRANAMSVWDVDDARVSELGPRVGALEFVSHCYRRPRRLPAWRYNLFAMVHGRTRADTAEKIEAIRSLLGTSLHASDVLYSTRILKKTGMRIA
jgi:siroheme decarboxylase